MGSLSHVRYTITPRTLPWPCSRSQGIFTYYDPWNETLIQSFHGFFLNWGCPYLEFSIRRGLDHPSQSPQQVVSQNHSQLPWLSEPVRRLVHPAQPHHRESSGSGATSQTTPQGTWIPNGDPMWSSARLDTVHQVSLPLRKTQSHCHYCHVHLHGDS